MPDLTEVPLLAGFYTYPWGDVPPQFRMVVDKARLSKLIRNADNVRHYSLGLEVDITPQKTALLSDLRASNFPEGWRCAVTFNGLDLFIIGAITEGAHPRTDAWLDAFETRDPVTGLATGDDDAET